MVKKQPKKWIQNAVKNPGATRKYIRRKYGDKGFDSKGRLKTSVLNKELKNPKLPPKRRKQINLAKTLKKIAENKRK